MKVTRKEKSKTKENKELVKKELTDITDLLKVCKSSDDFKTDYFQTQALQSLWLSYFQPIVDTEILHKDILKPIELQTINSLEDLKRAVPIQDVLITSVADKAQKKLLNGYVMIRLSEEEENCILINAESKQTRQIQFPEVEFSVVGPKEAFVESISTNLNLVRKRIPIPELKTKEIQVGKLSKTKVAILSIDGITNEENLNTVVQRIKSIDFDQIIDSSYITQMISDNQKSPFPQLLDTERPDRVAAVLAEGKVVVIVDGSPQALIGPTTLTEFFSAFEDYFLNPYIASIFRLIRFIAVLFSILVTPIYVATLTYHYELIPKDLLGTLISSRRVVPLPPILEAIILELTIELLREAGARLPTKVGQTIGIVGGIVIGTASVEAGLTSNVLLIIVALAALASFTTPVYQMGNTIRLLRFPFLFFAQAYGMLGIVICFCFLLAHLLRLTSLGRPFLEPVFPPRLKDFKDTIFRFPFSLQTKRPVQLQTYETKRFDAKDAKAKKDIDE
jgi:hypothetical protein